MARKMTPEIFKLAITSHTEILRREYLKLIEQTKDENYAKQHYQTILFKENPMVPYASVLFNELTHTFNHYQRLFGEQEAFSKTIELLPQIRHIANNALLMAKQFQVNKKPDLLADWYAYQIREKEMDLTDLILLEEKILKSDEEEIIGSLSLHLSGYALYKEFNPSEYPIKEVIETGKSQYSLNERILALSILLESLGFRQGLNEDRTSLAKIYHLIINKGFNEQTIIKNSNIYKSLGKLPQIVNDTQKKKIYLQNIRSFFEQANIHKALAIIDEQIKSDKKNN